MTDSSSGGEPLNGEVPKFLAIARIIKPQGRRGEVIAEILTDFGKQFQTCHQVFLRSGIGLPLPQKLKKVWPHKGRMVLKFEGVDSITDAEQLRGQDVLIPFEQRIPVPTSHFYLFELIGCRVVEPSPEGHRDLGTVEGLESNPGVDLLRVRRGKEELLIPFAQALCKKIDVIQKIIEVELPEDLVDLNRSASEGRRTGSGNALRSGRQRSHPERKKS